MQSVIVPIAVRFIGSCVGVIHARSAHVRRDGTSIMRDRIVVVALTAQPSEDAGASAVRSALECGPGRSAVVASLDRTRSHVDGT